MSKAETYNFKRYAVLQICASDITFSVLIVLFLPPDNEACEIAIYFSERCTSACQRLMVSKIFSAERDIAVAVKSHG
jgi:hypothetical protein